MLPELFHLPIIHLPIHTYGVLVVTGFLLAMYISYRQALRVGSMYNDILDFAFWALLGGMLGARVVYILVDFRKYFIEDPFVQLGKTGIKIPAVFAFWEGGLVYWGSFLGGLVAFLFFTHARRLPKLHFADLGVMGIPLAQAIGRLGCVAAGCCYGKPMYHIDATGQVLSDVPLAMQFPAGSLAYGGLLQSSSAEQVELMHTLGKTLPLFPSQLAESFGAMLLFFVMLWIAPRKFFHGQMLLVYAIGYSILRSFLEMYRGDTARGFVIEGVLSTSQFISILVVVVSLTVIFWVKRKETIAHPAR